MSEVNYRRNGMKTMGKTMNLDALEGKKVSLKKIAEILKRAKDTSAQYITFWP